MRKRERGDGRIFQQVYRVSKAGEVPPPGVPTDEWIEDPVSGDSVKWSRHRKRGEWTKWRQTASWYIAYSFRGKTRMESARKVDQGIAGTKADAVRLLKQRREEMGLDKRGIRPFTGQDRERVTFEDLKQIAEHDTQVNPRKSTGSWRAAWKTLGGFFAGRRAMAIDHAALQEYVAYRLKMGRSRGTIRVELATLRSAFNLAAVDGRALPPKFPSVEPSAPRKGFFEADQYQALLARLPDVFQPLVIFLRETGWRLSEGRTLEWRQVDLTTQVIRLDPGMTKNDEGRSFPFAALPDLDTLLRGQRERTSADEAATGRLIRHVFHDRGQPILPPRFYRAWWAAAKAARVYREWPHPETGRRCRGPLPHDFRRTTVRDLVAAGVPEKVSMELTGHKTRSIFDRYHIVNEQDKAQGIAQLARFRQEQGTLPRAVVTLETARRKRGTR
jgi:integrase